MIDTMIGFPHDGWDQYDFIRRQTKDRQSREEYQFPVEYMFKDVPKDLPTDDPVAFTLHEMDRFNIRYGLTGVGDETSHKALAQHPDRFLGSFEIDPNAGMDGIRALVRAHEEFGVRAAGCFPAGALPQVAINDKKMYPYYAKCVELGIPFFCCAGVPGPRLRMDPQRVELIDEVMYDFPELVFVTRHGCEPWTDLAVKLLLKWPNLYYSTSAFAPRYYPRAVVDFANTRGAHKILYAGYFPMGLTLDRIFGELPAVPFKDEVWPQFLYGNAARILGVS
ncbi:MULTISPECIES: amidohydrolase family protein [Streptacidiphilus]|uniref:Amidohydrolase family protein n=2 Tax=Streptacidiphilus TaxID=228398 RepID=A0ABV6UPK5_9ACTN|nr:amidohydrolase family protein [Streptacidiphilus jeojiense]